MRIRFLALFLTAFAVTSSLSLATDNTYVRFETTLGNIDVQLLTDEAPNTCANFMTYVNSGAYNSSLFHRLIPGFVIQGGVFTLSGSSINQITPNAAIASEAGVSNIQGTLTMALSTGPNSATCSWFFNLVDNSSTLDGTSDGGPFTVFGRVANQSSLEVMEALGSLNQFNFGVYETPNDTEAVFIEQGLENTPVINYTSADYAYYTFLESTEPTNAQRPGEPLQIDNLVLVNSIVSVTAQDYSAWSTANFTSTQLNDPTQSGPSVSAFPSDNVPNLLKFLCNINPSIPITVAERATLPILTKSGSNLLLTFHENPAVMNVSVYVQVQTSADLQTWTPAASPTFTQTGTDANGNAIIQVSVPQTGTQQYIRLNLTQSS